MPNASFIPPKVLSRAPLIEAMFELHWVPSREQEPALIGPLVETIQDPDYQVLIGAMFSRLRNKYPIHEPLPFSNVTLVPRFTVQHRFRAGENSWPVFQLGPGVLTVNFTDTYTWESFEAAVYEVLGALIESHPSLERFHVIESRLRYINGVPFPGADLFSFLAESLRVTVKVEQDLFSNTPVGVEPLGFDLRLGFPTIQPPGALQVGFTRGQRGGGDALIWDTMLHSVGDDAPATQDSVVHWMSDAHSVVHDWFFRTIQGKLLEAFE